VFCERVTGREFFLEGPLTVAFPDRYPLSPGHTLIVPKVHAADYFELAEAVQADLWRLVAEVKERLDEEFSPAGYNVGINVGAAAGQTVFHVHVHLVPRYDGDVSDPRGGIRHVLPARARYWDGA
jgi:diadenosine tetraphosphate (Ap4A) HIT family hydrolase